MPRVFVSIGSNIDREKNLRGAVRALATRFGPLTLSSVYESGAVGFAGDDFYNLVATFDTEEPVEELGVTLARIEMQHGRTRGANPFAPRTLDLDLLLYGDLVRHDGACDIPRPDIEKYAFVLGPLAELAPESRHPETGETFAGLWRRFSAPGQKLRRVPFDVAGA